jgi:hypothetical protein
MKNSFPFLVWMLCASAALAEPPVAPLNESQNAAAELVNKQLLLPLQKAESKRKRFSRAAPAPVERRVRVLDTEGQLDARGKQFVRFAIDVRHAWDERGAWQRDSVLGCAYPSEREVFVQQGRGYRAARSLLGQREKEQANVCRLAHDGATPLAKAAS